MHKTEKQRTKAGGTMTALLLRSRGGPLASKRWPCCDPNRFNLNSSLTHLCRPPASRHQLVSLSWAPDRQTDFGLQHRHLPGGADDGVGWSFALVPKSVEAADSEKPLDSIGSALAFASVPASSEADKHCAALRRKHLAQVQADEVQGSAFALACAPCLETTCSLSC